MIHNFYGEDYRPNFVEQLKAKWDKAHDCENVFRYKLDQNLEERFVDKYQLVLNPNRQMERRAPEEMSSLRQPFDENKFNFTKVSQNEVLFELITGGSDVHSIIVNVSPINRYHSLLCPSVNKCLPQVVTLESLCFAVDLMFMAKNRDMRILFNSLCGFASVNHLHYHLFLEKNDFFVEKVNWQHVHGDIHRLEKSYPIPAFCFYIPVTATKPKLEEVYKVLEHLLNKSIAHNILITGRRGFDAAQDNAVKVLVWPRKNTRGAKMLAAMNAAVLEFSGFYTIYDRGSFMKLTAEDLAKEQSKWQIADFDKLCEELKSL